MLAIAENIVTISSFLPFLKFNSHDMMYIDKDYYRLNSLPSY